MAASMEQPESDGPPQIKIVGPKFWVILTFWIVAVLVMSVYSVRKAFWWAGNVKQYQQEAAEEHGGAPAVE